MACKVVDALYSTQLLIATIHINGCFADFSRLLRRITFWSLLRIGGYGLGTAQRGSEGANQAMNQVRFVMNCGTNDEIHAARLLKEKHCEKYRSLCTSSLNLEKARETHPACFAATPVSRGTPGCDPKSELLNEAGMYVYRNRFVCRSVFIIKVSCRHSFMNTVLRR